MASEQKFSRLTLTAMVVGSMVGAGIFSLPARFGTATGPSGAIIAWIIAGGGLFFYSGLFLLIWWARHIHGGALTDEIAGIERNLEHWKL